MTLTPFAFLAAIALLLLVSRKNLALALFLAGIVLGLFTMSAENVASEIWHTLNDHSVLLLAVAVGLIPMIGGALEHSHLMEHLVENLRIGKRPFLALSPALIGMLPMPGGALLSAPLVEKGGAGVSNEMKAVLNVWFRHVFYLVYPLGPALIASAKIAGLEVYEVLPYLVPFFIFTLILGYLFFLRNVEGALSYTKKFSLRALLIPLGIIVIAPVLDFAIPLIIELPVRELSTVVAVLTSFGLALLIGRLKLSELRAVAKNMRPWYFALIIICLFIFINIFKTSNASRLIAGLAPSPPMFLVAGGFVLGAAIGRIQVPASIIIPIYLAVLGHNTMAPLAFAIAFFSIFLGYVLSPVHPCITVSLEYFKVPLKAFIMRLAPPALIGLALVLILAFLGI